MQGMWNVWGYELPIKAPQDSEEGAMAWRRVHQMMANLEARGVTVETDNRSRDLADAWAWNFALRDLGVPPSYAHRDRLPGCVWITASCWGGWPWQRPPLLLVVNRSQLARINHAPQVGERMAELMPQAVARLRAHDQPQGPLLAVAVVWQRGRFHWYESRLEMRTTRATSSLDN